MSYITWDANNRLGHAIIDEDHQEMANRINALGEAIFQPAVHSSPGERRARIDAAISALGDVTQRHFLAEETIMSNSGYPALASHRQQHEDLLRDFERFAVDFHKARSESRAHVIRFLKEWFEYHVQIWDQPLVTWLNQREDT